MSTSIGMIRGLAGKRTDWPYKNWNDSRIRTLLAIPYIMVCKRTDLEIYDIS